MTPEEALDRPPLTAPGALDAQGERRHPTAQRRPSPAWSHLNFFQRMMLRWRELHPYNPVHVVRVPAPLDAESVLALLAAPAGLPGG